MLDDYFTEKEIAEQPPKECEPIDAYWEDDTYVLVFNKYDLLSLCKYYNIDIDELDIFEPEITEPYILLDVFITSYDDIIKIKYVCQILDDLIEINIHDDFTKLKQLDVIYFYISRGECFVEVDNLVEGLALADNFDLRLYGTKEMLNTDLTLSDIVEATILDDLVDIYEVIKYIDKPLSKRVLEYEAWQKLITPIRRQGVIVQWNYDVYGIIYDPTTKCSRVIEALCNETIPSEYSFFFADPTLAAQYVDLF